MSLKLGNRKPIDFSNTKIYKITNKINGKVYIGQTTNTINRRFNSHSWNSSGCVFLHNALNKYGKDNFTIEQIDHAHSKEEANAKEIYYINKYDTTNHKKGYNITKGGSNVSERICRKIICIETGEIFNSMTDACKKYNLKSNSTISCVCVGVKKTCKGFHWAYVDENNKPLLDNIDITTQQRKTPIVCVETGKLYNMITDACKEVGCSTSQMSSVLKGRCKTAGGYHWKYLNKENIKEKPINKNRKKVKVICIDTKEIFKSVSECAKYFNVYRSQIYNSIKYGYSCNGFHFMLGKEK